MPAARCRFSDPKGFGRNGSALSGTRHGPLMTKLVDRIDRAIFGVFPGWGARRMAVRHRCRQAMKLADGTSRTGESEARFISGGRMFEGAQWDRLRGDSWLVSQLSLNSGMEWDLKNLRDRSNDLCRSSPYALGMVESHVVDTIGSSLSPKPRIPTLGPITKEQAKQWKQQLEWLFYRWAPSAAYDGDDFLNTMRLADRCWQRDGDVLIIFRDQGSVDKPIPLALEVIESDRIETAPIKLGDPNVRLGVERDPETKRTVGYWIRKTYPGDTREASLNHYFVPKYDSNGRQIACLLYDRFYPGQVRGLPAMFAAINRLKDIADCEDSVRLQEAVSASFCAFLTVNGSPEEAAEGALSTGRSGGPVEEIHPGTIQRLGEGEDITFGQPQLHGGDHASWIESQLRSFACATNRTYTSVARDWKAFTMSGGRLELIQAKRLAKGSQYTVESRVLQPLYRRIALEGVVVGEIDIDPFLFSSNESLITQHGWLFQGMDWLDPQRDIMAAALAVKCKFKSRHAIMGSMGDDFDETLAELAEEEEDIRGLGMDPAMPSLNGTADPGDDSGSEGQQQDNSSNPNREAEAAAV